MLRLVQRDGNHYFLKSPPPVHRLPALPSMQVACPGVSAVFDGPADYMRRRASGRTPSLMASVLRVAPSLAVSSTKGRQGKITEGPRTWDRGPLGPNNWKRTRRVGPWLRAGGWQRHARAYAPHVSAWTYEEVMDVRICMYVRRVSGWSWSTGMRVNTPLDWQPHQP
jgi:hypothetical protein